MSEVRCGCQGLGLVARIEASILAFDTKPVLYRPVLDQIQFCSFDRRCKTCLDTKPVLYQGRFCSLTTVSVWKRHTTIGHPIPVQLDIYIHMTYSVSWTSTYELHINAQSMRCCPTHVNIHINLAVNETCGDNITYFN